jgi:hypothetical protein
MVPALQTNKTKQNSADLFNKVLVSSAIFNKIELREKL